MEMEVSRQRLKEVRADATLKELIRHLVLSFPQTAIFSRQVGDAYYVFVIAPYDGGLEKAIQVERALLTDHHAALDDFRHLLETLDLPGILKTCDRSEIRSARRSAPANEGWPAAPIGSTVSHGPFDLSGPSLPTPPGALLPVRAE
jgi:hypothetical protein